MIYNREPVLDKLFGLTNSMLVPDFIVEVGSFDGESLKTYGTFSPYSRLIGFECNPINYFKRCLGKPVNYMTITNHTGSTEIYRPVSRIDDAGREHTRGNDRVSGIHMVDNATMFETYTTPCSTLDDYFEVPLSQGKTFSLIVDAEGAAYEILQGAQKFLQNVVSMKLELETVSCWEGQKLEAEVLPLVPEKFVKIAETRYTGKPQKQNNSYFFEKDAALYFKSIGGELQGV